MPVTATRKFSICFLDDKIPLPFDSGVIDHRALSLLLLDSKKWKDIALFSLINNLDSKRDKYILSGFIHCDHFINYIDEVIFSPDIIIYDWDYPAGSPPEDALLKILEYQFSQVFIFTGVDTEGAVDSVIARDKFKKYKNRIGLIKKGDLNSVDDLQTKIESALQTFSFKYSKELKQKTIKAVDTILSIMGELSFEEFIRFYGEKVNTSTKTQWQLSAFEFTEIIADKLKTKLIDVGVGDGKDVLVDNGTTVDDENLMREIWGFRLYHHPKDFFVRCGDIVEIAGRKVMVISSDCDLARFWQKNMGHLMVTPLYRIDDAALKKDLNDFNAVNIDKFTVTSLTNPQAITSITVLPGLEFEESSGAKKYWDYIVSAKATYSVPIKKPANVVNLQSSLRYEHVIENEEFYKNRKRIAEPFLTPLIEWIMRNITGLGVPDFSKKLQESLKAKVKETKNDAGT